MSDLDKEAKGQLITALIGIGIFIYILTVLA